MSPTVIAAWSTQGVLAGALLPWISANIVDISRYGARGPYVTMSAIHQWEATSVRVGQAAAELGVSLTQMQGWIVDGHIIPLWQCEETPMKHWWVSLSLLEQRSSFPLC